MGLIFRLVINIITFFQEVFASLDKQYKEKRLRNKIINAQNLEIEKLDKSEAEKELYVLTKVFRQILDKNHEYYRDYILGPSKKQTQLFYALSSKHLDYKNPIFNKRAMDICTVEELYLFSFILGKLFYKAVYDLE